MSVVGDGLGGSGRTASKLVHELVEAADDKQLTKLINRYGPDSHQLTGSRSVNCRAGRAMSTRG
jgi:hypothetical protein